MNLPPRMSMRAVARWAGISDRTMRRRLHILNEQCGGYLLVANAAGRGKKIVDMSVLRRMAPDMFSSDLATVDDVEDIKERIGALENAQRVLVGAMARMQKAIRDMGGNAA